MNKDLHLAVTNPQTHKTSTERLSWATSIFYFGMLAGLFPLTFIFQRFHVGRTVGMFIILWGIVAMSTAGVTTFKGLYAQRFFLGFLEACVPTCFMTVVSGYYTQAEQTSRQCIWYASTGSGAIMGGLINFGFAHVKHAPLSAWKYVYLFAGSVTVLLGIVFLFVPNSPAEAWFLTSEEKVVAVERLRCVAQSSRRNPAGSPTPGASAWRIRAMTPPSCSAARAAASSACAGEPVPSRTKSAITRASSVLIDV